jgi:phosphoglycolate phosphatase
MPFRVRAEWGEALRFRSIVEVIRGEGAAPTGFGKIMIRKPEMILIDVDGTLVDSVPDLHYCVDEMMRALGMPLRGEAKVRTWVGNGVERLVRRSLANSLDGEPDEALFQRAYPIFLGLYTENTSKRSRLYPGVTEGLDMMARAGYKLGCVTNKAAQFTIPLLKDLGVYDRFAIVVSGDTLPEKKPHPMPLLHAAEFFGVKPEKALMLGDSVSDVKAARAAGFQIVCMSYGYNHGVDIREAKPDAVIDSMVELVPLLEGAA